MQIKMKYRKKSYFYSPLCHASWCERTSSPEVSVQLTSRSLVEKLMSKFGIALKIATRDCIVLLYTTGLYCLKSSGVNPLSWMILEKIKNTNVSLSGILMDNIFVFDFLHKLELRIQARFEIWFLKYFWIEFFSLLSFFF